jgi:hypothetical protein
MVKTLVINQYEENLLTNIIQLFCRIYMAGYFNVRY